MKEEGASIIGHDFLEEHPAGLVVAVSQLEQLQESVLLHPEDVGARPRPKKLLHSEYAGLRPLSRGEE